MEELKASVSKYWSKMPKACVAKVCKSFRDPVEAILKANEADIHK